MQLQSTPFFATLGLMAATTFIGVNISSGWKPFTYAALDDDRHLLALGQCGLPEVLTYTTAQTHVLAGINAPPRPSLLKAAGEAPLPARQMRQAEYTLRQRGVRLTRTPCDPDECPLWMQRGFAFYRHLEAQGFQPHPHPEAPRQWLETQAEAGYWALLGQPPLPARTLEGCLQRQLALYDLDLDIRDPMDYFEEITRFKLRRGMLPAGVVYSITELDAMLAALVAWFACHEPDRMVRVGDLQEGEIWLPGLPEKPLPNDQPGLAFHV